MKFSASLRGGNRRSIGQSDQLAALVERYPVRFEELWDCLGDSDALVRMRAADALEKVSRSCSSLFAMKKKILLSRCLDDGTAEVRWHLVAIVARLPLSEGEAAGLMRFLAQCVRCDESRIVKVMALQAAADIRDKHAELDAEICRLLDWARASPWPSVRARARKLTKR
jgi:hypothetical protein